MHIIPTKINNSKAIIVNLEKERAFQNIVKITGITPTSVDDIIALFPPPPHEFFFSIFKLLGAVAYVKIDLANSIDTVLYFITQEVSSIIEEKSKAALFLDRRIRVNSPYPFEIMNRFNITDNSYFLKLALSLSNLNALGNEIHYIYDRKRAYTFTDEKNKQKRLLEIINLLNKPKKLTDYSQATLKEIVNNILVKKHPFYILKNIAKEINQEITNKKLKGSSKKISIDILDKLSSIFYIPKKNEEHSDSEYSYYGEESEEEEYQRLIDAEYGEYGEVEKQKLITSLYAIENLAAKSIVSQNSILKIPYHKPKNLAKTLREHIVDFAKIRLSIKVNFNVKLKPQKTIINADFAKLEEYAIETLNKVFLKL